MITFDVVFNSDLPNLSGSRFTVGALESALAQSWEIGTPSFISHDYHRPAGWSRPLALHIQPGLARLAGRSQIPETSKESRLLESAIRQYLGRRPRETFDAVKEDFEAVLGDHLNGTETPCLVGCAALERHDLAREVFPDIFDEEDKDGLVPLELLEYAGGGAFRRGNLLLFAHQYFRRSMSRLNNLNCEFLDLLDRLRNSDSLNLRLALDPDALGWAPTYARPIELQYWWGPKFNDDLSRIPIGVARHEAEKEMQLFHGISATEFWWYVQGGKRTFECEEIRDLPSYGVGDSRFGCRFVHSMAADREAVFHMDGAIRDYSGEQLLARMETDLSKSGRHTDYTKLWRIDGKLPVSSWKELLTHYFRDNRLVGEYLGAKESTNLLQVTPNKQHTPLSDFVPCDVTPEHGVMVAVSYHPTFAQSEPRVLQTCSKVSYEGNDTYDAVEADGIKILKLFRRNGIDCEVPKDLIRVAFEDRWTNLPWLLHGGSTPVEAARVTLQTIKLMVDYWVREGDERLLSYTLLVPYASKSVAFSFAGHVSSLSRWLSSDVSGIPDSDIGSWCDDVAEYLYAEFPDRHESPDLHDLLTASGSLEFTRRFVEDREASLTYNKEASAIETRIRIDAANTELQRLLATQELEIAPAVWIKASDCSSCGLDYSQCLCTEFLDEGVSEVVADMRVLGLFWTNSKA